MTHYGWPEDQAFDALRQASRRENIKVRDLAAKIVAKTAQSTSRYDTKLWMRDLKEGAAYLPK